MSKVISKVSLMQNLFLQHKNGFKNLYRSSQRHKIHLQPPHLLHDKHYFHCNEYDHIYAFCSYRRTPESKMIWVPKTNNQGPNVRRVLNNHNAGMSLID